MVIKAGSMEEDTFYRFKVCYSNEKTDCITYVYVEFWTNAAPKDGSFQVIPSEGFFYTTEFNFIANGWTDEDSPIYY